MQVKYLLWAVLFLQGILYLPRGHRQEIPLGILLIAAPVGGVVLTVLEESRAAFWAVHVVLAAVVLGGAVAEFVGRHWITGLAFVALGVLAGFVWRDNYRRRRSAVQVVP